MKLYVATTNVGKLREFALAGGGAHQIEAIRPTDPPEETGATFEENAAIKAACYSQRVEGLLLGEDSGLEVDALGGAPGIHSARYSPEGHDETNNALLLANLANETNRKARYVCAIAIAQQGKVLATFRGTVEGEILRERRGTGGFGYDPYFWYEPYQATFAELGTERVHAISHRRRALEALYAWLAQR